MEWFIHYQVPRMTCRSLVSSKRPHFLQLLSRVGCLSVWVTSSEGDSQMNGSHLRVASHLGNPAFSFWKTLWLFIATCRLLTYWSMYHWILGGIQSADPRICSHPLCHGLVHSNFKRQRIYMVNRLGTCLNRPHTIQKIYLLQIKGHQLMTSNGTKLNCLKSKLVRISDIHCTNNTGTNIIYFGQCQWDTWYGS